MSSHINNSYHIELYERHFTVFTLSIQTTPGLYNTCPKIWRDPFYYMFLYLKLWDEWQTVQNLIRFGLNNSLLNIKCLHRPVCPNADFAFCTVCSGLSVQMQILHSALFAQACLSKCRFCILHCLLRPVCPNADFAFCTVCSGLSVQVQILYSALFAEACLSKCRFCILHCLLRPVCPNALGKMRYIFL